MNAVGDRTNGTRGAARPGGADRTCGPAGAVEAAGAGGAFGAGKGGSLLAWARERGYRVTWGGVQVLDEVRADILRRKDLGEFDAGFYARALEGAFRYGERLVLSDPKSVVIVSVPRPAHALRFEMGDRCVRAMVPPTYLRYETVNRQVLDGIRLVLAPEYDIARLETPLKAVAVRLGLAAYGRNNVTYVPGFGSYHQLVGCVCDAELGPAPTARREAAELLPECARCRACLNACPTGAIAPDRVLLRAERCLTFLNEYPGQWPDWLPKTANHCLVGCLRCQVACPHNEDLQVEDVEETFSPDDTERIIAGPPREGDKPWERVVSKLESAGLAGYGPVIGRNLSVLL